MSSVAQTGQTRFRDTCVEAKKFFSIGELESGVEEKIKVCEGLLHLNIDVQPIDVKEDRSKSVLFDACILAEELAKMEENKWELISKVWVAQLLGKGGELVTCVSILMAHFGVGEQFQINEGHAREKLIVKK
ncbi:PREDICTED: unnamed product [Prunus dulcis]|uniref:PREDICTED: unnamed product n=1 Tax=Prunus dulcis TaxID=3755 RepID=A0A5E4FLY4_PRUDU|nr:PREDICTED: unnamed product [Prunus dulcis]